MTSTELAYEKGLPANLDAERFVLGSILLNDTVYLQVAGAVEPDDFSLEKHRRIFARMKDLYDRGERIDRVTVANELMKQGQLESVDGLGVPGFARRRAAGDRESRKLHPHRQGQGDAAQADLQRAESDRPVPDRRG